MERYQSDMTCQTCPVSPLMAAKVQKLKAAKASIRVDFIFADAMKQQGWVKEATLLLVHTNLSATNLRELRTRAGGMQVSKYAQYNKQSQTTIYMLSVNRYTRFGQTPNVCT